MKAKDAAFIAVIVFFRTAAVCAAGFGSFMVLLPLLVGLFSGGINGTLYLLQIVIAYFLAAAVLWLFAKPIASLVVRGLDDRES